MVTRQGRSRKGDRRHPNETSGLVRPPPHRVRWTLAPDAPTIIAIRPAFVPGHLCMPRATLPRGHR